MMHSKRELYRVLRDRDLTIRELHEALGERDHRIALAAKQIQRLTDRLESVDVLDIELLRQERDAAYEALERKRWAPEVIVELADDLDGRGVPGLAVGSQWLRDYAAGIM